MVLVVKAERVRVENSKVMQNVLDHLRKSGYNPLISQARTGFLKTFGGTARQIADDSEVLVADEDLIVTRAYDRVYQRLRGQYFGIPVLGDIMFSPNSKGLLYVRILIVRNRDQPKEPNDFQLEIGFVGDDSELDSLSSFSTRVKESLPNKEKSIELTTVEPRNGRFLELAKGETTKFVPATEVSESDVKLASILEDKEKRELALTVRRAGGMLAADLGRKFTKLEAMQNITDELIRERLLNREYVVICRQTSNQINRVKSLDVIEKMREHGVLCSCGTPIGNELVQELFSPSNELHKILKQSYWMTAELVRMLRDLGLPNSRILLNLQEGPEEIDTFVDLEGVLLMFELKDSEFSMGHAYPFSGRIGLYTPDYAIIVATNGIAPEVKTYFERIKPAAAVRYVDHLKELKQELGRIRNEIYVKRARGTLSSFDPMASMEVSVSEILGKQFGIPAEPGRRRYFGEDVNYTET
jgi:hypothetical protein